MQALVGVSALSLAAGLVRFRRSGPRRDPACPSPPGGEQSALARCRRPPPVGRARRHRAAGRRRITVAVGADRHACELRRVRARVPGDGQLLALDRPSEGSIWPTPSPIASSRPCAWHERSAAATWARCCARSPPTCAMTPSVRAELRARQSWIVNAARLGVVAPWIVLLMLATRPEGAAAYNSPAGARAHPGRTPRLGVGLPAHDPGREAAGGAALVPMTVDKSGVTARDRAMMPQ